MMAKAKTSRINRNALAPCDASAYCKDLDRWARSWMGLEKDLPPGEALVACFRPFIEHLASSGLAPRTIRRHVNNLWLLGGEIIRDLNYNPSYDDGGPLIHNGSEEDQRSLDATCRKLHRFLTQSQR